MSELQRLLDTEPVVAAAGTDLLADAVEQQGGSVQRSDWKPPVNGTEAALAHLAAGGVTYRANEEALRRLLEARPQLVDVAVARDVVSGMTERTFLHAGPPVEWDDASGPLRGALIGALRRSGLQ